MMFIDAIKTNRPLTRPSRAWTYISDYSFIAQVRGQIVPGTLIDPNFLIQHVRLTKEDLLATDWIVQGGINDTDYEFVE